MSKTAENASLQTCAKKGKTKICSIGGQALLEGVMMKSPSRVAMAVRRQDGRIQASEGEYTPLTKKKKWYSWPIVRGCVSFYESMKSGMESMTYAATALGEVEEEPSKFEWMSNKLGKSVESVVFGTAIVLGIALAVGLFVLLPSFLGKLLAGDGATPFALNLIEGGVRILILIGYMASMNLIKDIRRVFMYHGAEHKTIAAYEEGLLLTVENVRPMSRLHPRCGTNYLFLVAFISILFYSVVGFTGHWALKSLLKIALLPLVAGASYEVLKAAAKSDHILARVARWPGMMLQHITTREPEDDMLEVSIAAFELALRPEEYLKEHPELIVTDTKGRILSRAKEEEPACAADQGETPPSDGEEQAQVLKGDSKKADAEAV
ncbi:MAG: DUF1385 domain-containing protein [Christensenellales bacterium]